MKIEQIEKEWAEMKAHAEQNGESEYATEFSLTYFDKLLAVVKAAKALKERSDYEEYVKSDHFENLSHSLNELEEKA